MIGIAGSVERVDLDPADLAFLQRHRLERSADFADWFRVIADRLYRCAGFARDPLPEAELDRLRLPRYRNGAPGDAPVPASLRAILAFDRGFVAWGRRPLCQPLLERRADDGRVRGVTMEEVLRRSFPGLFDALAPEVPIWNAHREAPALVELSAGGDQSQFLYLGELDPAGEPPIASFDTEPCLWITRASLVHYVVEALHHRGIPVTGSVSFRRLTADARRRNQRWEKREWWDRNPQLTRVMEQAASED